MASHESFDKYMAEEVSTQARECHNMPKYFPGKSSLPKGGGLGQAEVVDFYTFVENFFPPVEGRHES